MIELMRFCIANKIKGVHTQKDFLLLIGFTNTSNLKKVREGSLSFQPFHLKNACDIIGIDANYFFKEKAVMFMPGKKISPILLIKEGLKLLEMNGHK